MNNKKGAMFGLDARIALAIFGALSVISGAALYSAIKSAKTEKFRQFFVETEKASEHFYLENGSPLSQFDANNLNTVNLAINHDNLDTWNGPYMDYISTISYYGVKTSLLNSFSTNLFMEIYLHKASTWVNLAAYDDCVVGSDDCAEYIRIQQASATEDDEKLLKSLFLDLDNLVDGGDGELAGKVRALDGASFSYSIWYKSIPRKRTV
tara:strand:- start:1906 stop:2532 length:627 start_codon:yes stop_codon:yes gene_type:complete